VEERLSTAARLGIDLADLIGEPDSFVARLTRGLTDLADGPYAAAQERVAPGSGATIGVRWPLVHAIERALRPALREASPDVVLWLAQRLAIAPQREVRLFALPCLRRTIGPDPERSWQLMRRLAHGADDWIAVDAIAELFAVGVLAEGFRWAELEQLVYSERRMERRLVGSTLARIPHEVRQRDRAALRAEVALELVGQLMGDADDQVQKSLAWALREWARVDQRPVADWLTVQAATAASTDDGHRAWVIRDALSAQPPDVAARIRDVLGGVRRRAAAPPTSAASRSAAAFAVGALARSAIAQQGDRFTGRGA
jgi:3-methyladenine DNA glycosylase AlkD